MWERVLQLWKWYGHLNNVQTLGAILGALALAILGVFGIRVSTVDVLTQLSVLLAAVGVAALVFIAFMTGASKIGWLPPTDRHAHHKDLAVSAIATPTIEAKVIPAERHFVNDAVTPHYLVALTKDMTTVQAEALTKQYIGAWMA